MQPLRRWLSELEIRDRNSARLLCSLIPARCPFERTFNFFGRTVLSIPPLCKLNPFYNELVALRFRSLCYLAEVVGDDISRFC
ncbi:MAG: Mo-dependent nitrogenase C-terminal domain-containing protein [Stenomitos frigidus ULC029]